MAKRPKNGSLPVQLLPRRRATEAAWPNGARVAVWVCPNIEHYEYLPAEVRVRNPWPRMPHPDVLGYGGRDYGNRVGLWRMFEVLDKHSVRCTVSLSMSVIEMYPEILEAMEARRWEYMSHGYFNTRYHWGYGERRRSARSSSTARRRTSGSPAASCAAGSRRHLQHAQHARSRARGRAWTTSATSITTTSRRRSPPSTAP